MALTFTKKAAGQVGGKAKEAQAETSTSTKAANQSKSNVTSMASWMKKGAAAKEALQHEEAAAELRAQERGKLWRFWMPEGEDRTITFLDGGIDDEGMLDILMYYEHNIRVNGNWEQFVCTAEADQTQPCPICEKGDKPSLVGVMTIIDHSEHKVKNGPNAGKVIKNTRKLFVAKRNTIMQLTKLAAKRGGLTGCTFDVSRVGENSASVGSQFDFQHKFSNRQEIMDKFDLKEEDVMPANYAEEIRYRSPEELIELGVGKAQTGIGHSTSSKKSLSDEL